MKYFVILSFLFSSLLSSSQNLKTNLLFKHVDERVKSLSAKEYNSLDELYKTIVLTSYSEAEKVRAIAKYITNTIAYDITYKHSKTPLNTVKRKKGVCQDYAELFKALCDIGNIECHVVTGNGRSSNSEIGLKTRSNHAWNAVKINNAYHLFDLTWATGYVDDLFVREYNEYYYNTPPEQFINDHFPNNQKWQLLINPISKHEYENIPAIDDGFQDLIIGDFSPKIGVVKTNYFQLKFKSDLEITECVLFKWGLHDFGSVGGIYIPVMKNGDTYTISFYNDVDGVYRYNFVLNDSASITYKVITLNYKPSSPTEWDATDPYGLIEAYHSVFYNMDQELFNKLNPNSTLKNLESIKYASELNGSLSDWYGDYRMFYIHDREGNIEYPINNYNVVLKKEDSKYQFKEITKR